ncbi:MAG: SLBB domain-containing protein [Deltaproteobacteria bacterium]|nr:SLBB domain-containing protein [Deltaproteobacteria bacterium]
MQQTDIAKLVFEAGVVGAGGGGFPAHVKLQARVDTVLANGSECEPLLVSDKTLMKYQAADVVAGLKVAMRATGAAKGVIAVKGVYRDVVASLKDAMKDEPAMTLHELQNYYPAGDEFLTVYDVTGRIIPEGGIPLNVGVVVSNVLTLCQMAHAMSGKPVTERLVTVAGEVNNPCVVSVPIGTTVKDLLAMAGSVTTDDAVVIEGGLMMGGVIEDLDQGIAKTTSGLIVVPRESFIVRAKTVSLSQMIKLSKAACCQCFRCTDLCPRNLLGHELYPHMTMRTIDYNISEPAHHVTAAFLCSQCGVCELIACDFMLLSPKKIYAAYKKELISKGVKNPHHKVPERVGSAYEDRKVAIDVLTKKLSLGRYKKEAAYLGFRETGSVRVPITRHVGAGAVPVVKTGARVQKGDVIAVCPEGSLGANYHASMTGVIGEVTQTYIGIARQG